MGIFRHVSTKKPQQWKAKQAMADIHQKSKRLIHISAPFVLTTQLSKWLVISAPSFDIGTFDDRHTITLNFILELVRSHSGRLSQMEYTRQASLEIDSIH